MKPTNMKGKSMRRSVALTVLIIILLIPIAALANHAEDLAIDCDGWSAKFLEFNHTDHELLITVNGLEVSYDDNPPDGDFVRSGPLPEGIDGIVTLATFWRHLQGQVEGPALTVELDCTPEITTTTTTTTPNNTTTTTTQTVETTTTTAAAPCAEGLVHQPPMCVDPTTTTVTTAALTTTAPPATTDTLPFTGVDETVYKVAALGASLSMLFGLVILMFVKREMD